MKKSILVLGATGKPFMIGTQPHPVHFFAACDLAKMVSRSFIRQEAANMRFYINGPEAITMRSALESYCRNVHPDGEKVSVMPIWMTKVIARVSKNQSMIFAANLMEYFNNTVEKGDASEASQILGAPESTLEEWIQTQKLNTFGESS